MKHFLTTIALFCLTISFSQKMEIKPSNTIKITYEYQASFSSIANYDTYLYVSETGSQFVNFRKKQSFEVKNIKVTQGYLNYINNYDFKEQIIEENRILDDKTKLYAQWKNDIVWEITDEVKKIGKYTVRKAITNSFEINSNNDFYYGKAIAWFTTDIPIPSGPARYYGLPGLILELGYEENGAKFVFKEIDFQSEYEFIELDKNNEVEKLDVIYFNHKNPKEIKEIQKGNKKRKK